MTHDATLEKFRKKIDALDDELVALFKKRADIVAQVGVHKRSLKQNREFLRPGREAEMVRDFCTRDAGKMAPHVLGAMWRLLISGSLQIEKTLIISALAPKGSVAEYYWLAREYFGMFTPIHVQHTAKAVINDLLEGDASVGVLPLPSNAQEDPVVGASDE